MRNPNFETWMDFDNYIQCAWVYQYLTTKDNPSNTTLGELNYFQEQDLEKLLRGEELFSNRRIEEGEFEKCRSNWEQALQLHTKKWLKNVQKDNSEQCHHLIEYLSKRNIKPLIKGYSKNPYFTLINMTWNWDESLVKLKKSMMHSWSVELNRKGKKGLNVQLSAAVHKRLKTMAKAKSLSTSEYIESLVESDYARSKAYKNKPPFVYGQHTIPHLQRPTMNINNATTHNDKATAFNEIIDNAIIELKTLKLE